MKQWNSDHVIGRLTRGGGLRIIHNDGAQVYLQPSPATSDLIRTLEACGDDRNNIGVLLCDMLEGI